MCTHNRIKAAANTRVNHRSDVLASFQLEARVSCCCFFVVVILQCSGRAEVQLLIRVVES